MTTGDVIIVHNVAQPQTDGKQAPRIKRGMFTRESVEIHGVRLVPCECTPCEGRESRQPECKPGPDCAFDCWDFLASLTDGRGKRFGAELDRIIATPGLTPEETQARVMAAHRAAMAGILTDEEPR